MGHEGLSCSKHKGYHPPEMDRRLEALSWPASQTDCSRRQRTVKEVRGKWWKREGDFERARLKEDEEEEDDSDGEAIKQSLYYRSLGSRDLPAL